MAVNPQGEMQYWDNGFPFGGVLLGSNDAGEMQFWDNGFPIVYQIPTSAPPPPAETTLLTKIDLTARTVIRKINGAVYSLIKKANRTRAN